MGRKKHLFETLESRRLLSIAGAALSPPLTAGAKWTVTNGGNSESVTVIGNTTFMGHAVTKVQDNTTSSDGTTDLLIYVGKDSANDIVFYGVHDTTTNSSGSSVTDISFDSGLVQLPASMTAGVSQTFNTDATGTNTSTVDGKTKTTSISGTEKTVITLVSSSTQTVTVPAGTFKCYQIKSVRTVTEGANSSTTTDNT